MAFTPKTWYDAPNPLTPLSAAALNDLESRIAAAAGSISTIDGAPAVCVTNSADQNLANTTTVILGFDTEEYDVDNQHYTSTANLTGTVAKTASSTAIVGTGTTFTSQLSIGQVIDIPGTATERRVVTAITDDTHLTVSANLANTASGQTAARVNSALVARTAGVYNVFGLVRFAANASANRRQVTIQYTTGTTAMAVRGSAIAAGVTESLVPTDVPISRAIKLSQWDFVQLACFQSTGGTIAATGGAFSPVFGMNRVSAG